ncbi:TonB-dependent receptor [Sediminicola luteus]|uniref:Collagen-binding protein n=1 Tax=Sediminicola luteus TaxID=319238 RepID=A0A2A4G5D4_9FLAO|nr:TonB-dependent receptor [Sediminicola luteus]PCE63641.1 collagen-binding protein [Sediminicola luteus]
MSFRRASVFLFLFVFPLAVLCQNSTLSGTITDADSGETLVGVTLFFPDSEIWTTTNAYGFFSVELEKGAHRIIINLLGYATLQETLELQQNTQFDFKLKPQAQRLEEVVLTETTATKPVTEARLGVHELSAKGIKNIPVVLGEPDVLNALVMLPGVSNAGEGSSGFNVRGGAADQNLILLDEATLFNSSHLFGFFSVFNPDAIKDLSLYKGDIPAKYGGRLSSVLDIYQKEGNNNRFSMSGGIGVVSSRLLAEGPLVKDKGSFLVGARSSYAHLFLKLTDNDNSAYFYDVNAKVSHRLGKRDKLFLSGYFGRDVFKISERFVNTYGNMLVNLRWNHLYTDKLFGNLSLIYSDYFYGLDLDFVGLDWKSGINNINLKYDFKHYLSNALTLEYGLNSIYYAFNPGTIAPTGPDSGINPDQLTEKFAWEWASYIDASFKPGPKWDFRLGLRYSHFNRKGQDELFTYDSNGPVHFNQQFQIYQKAEPTGSISPNKNDNIATFNAWEPRAALSYNLNEQEAIKASYARMTQYLHLISNTNSPTPLDIWAPSGPYIDPQRADIWSAGYAKYFNKVGFSLETEVFYKNIKNRLDYIDGANLVANDAIEQVVLPGRARAYGWEVLIKKEIGAFNGWLGYTLSKSEQRTPGRNSNEPGINSGKWYNTPFDKTHDVSVSAGYNWNEKWRFACNFLYQTGQPSNFPIGQFEFKNLTVPIYGDRNVDRLPAYHRLDLSATLRPKKNADRHYQSQWVFGLYNVYNRDNAFTISFSKNTDNGVNEAVKTSIFGIVPAITYNFSF